MHVYFFPFPLSILGALFLHFEIISAMYLLECLRLLGTSFPKKYIYFVLPFGGFWGLWYQSLHSATIGANSGQVAPLLRGGDHSQIGSSLSHSQTFFNFPFDILNSFVMITKIFSFTSFQWIIDQLNRPMQSGT